MSLQSPSRRLAGLFLRPSSVWLLRLAGWIAGIALVCFAALLLLLRLVLLPQIENYRDDVERELSAALHLPLSIGHIDGRMQGLRPRLDLHQLAIKDEQGRPALSFDNVTAIVGWKSLLYFEPRLYLLEVSSPVLAIRRDPDGNLFVAGLPVETNTSSQGFSDWLLAQSIVSIRDATVTWTDELRAAPPLTLDHLDFKLTNSGRHHRFGFTAQPPALLAAKVDIRGELSGSDLADTATWRGQLYGDIPYADLAGWQTWIDYPIELPRGRGAARVWLDFSARRLQALTADLSLADAELRLAPSLPVLSLARLNGRVSGKLLDGEFELSTKGLSLSTRDGVVLAPTELSITRDASGGRFAVNTLDFHALSLLSAYLPLPEHFQQRLLSYSPRGVLQDFQIDWKGSQWPFSQYDIKGRFQNLAVASTDTQPGFSGLSGSIAGDNEKGTLQLAGMGANFTLPAVFHLPFTLDTMTATVHWRRSDSGTVLDLSEVKFRNADAEGTASGTYELRDKGMGVIDLDAKVSRAEGTSVWRYIPLQAGADVGPFLHASVLQGKASDVTLKVKGDLDNFPFADRSGTFRIHGLLHNAVLRYAADWPQIDAINGIIDFDGPAMTITANEGRILGVGIGPVKAEIPDLVTFEEQLLVSGKAAGATTNFLKFIEASPVGQRIDHFTEGMTASGNGELDLKLVMPLRHIDQSKVAGSYRFDGNRLRPDPDLPALEDVRGRIEFTSDNLFAKDIAAKMFGSPMLLNLKTLGDGGVQIDVSGDAGVADLRRQFPHPLFDDLAGSAHWNGVIKARKKSIEVRISSNLQGLSSSLPEPFNKPGTEALPLVFERKAMESKPVGKRLVDNAPRDVTDFTLGRVVRARLQRRHDGDKVTTERGLISIGDTAARLPERGILVSVSQPRLNVDFWRHALLEKSDKPAPTKTGKPAVPPAADADALSGVVPGRIELKTGELIAMGRAFHDVRVVVTRPLASWNADINSREVVAKLDWADGESPKLSGRITRFALPEAAAETAVSIDSAKVLPNLDLVLDHLALNGRDYGELHLTAENKGNDWNATFSVRSDDGVLEGQGRWRTLLQAQTITGSDTQLDFKLHAKSVEKLLNRIGYPNTVRRGNADLSGRLAWKGAPHDFDIASMNGQLNLEAHDGQFNKLEPGVGRLLGVLSLQSIPRRITLDFRDIFSEGFAFDMVKGQVAVSNGVLDTHNMEIRGPAAKVQLAGSVDLNKETQDLKVRVHPTLSESVATGVLFVHPAIGATAWAFNKLFGNPLDNVFAYDFAVTGAWADPKVDKIATQAGGGAKPDTEK